MADGGVEQGRLAPLRKRWKAVSAVTAALAAVAVTVPVVLADSDGAPPCQAVPASTRALAGDPAAATRALDPGEDLSRLPAVRALFVERPCGDGGAVLGRVVDAGTRVEGRAHSLEQARSAYGVVRVLGRAGEPLPAGLTTAVAGLLSAYVVDQSLYFDIDRDDERPAVTAEQAEAFDPRPGSFLAPGEAHAHFSYTGSSLTGSLRVGAVRARTVWDPRVFAILYDAERAYFAHYLERLTDNGADPDRAPGGSDRSSTSWVDRDLGRFGDRLGALMGMRTELVRNGTIPDVAEFDRAVRKHTRGAYLAADRRVTSRTPQGTIAARPVSGPVQGQLMDGRAQLYAVLEKWAATRGTPEARVVEMRRSIDKQYLQSFVYPD
ncbi:hypothetical protein IAG44_05310 [Streptomyces roseirectus]|uniref:Uncharacterized protein n=1 Tax=Streptomyces roseirectus TaxID=2768066 RepID=A0A7H0I806_9ACTN|nr:hypothetical protein [Streptomyces roseirectus]QNP68922.1 hypothetical protein IAG44_05310 [Streptomyces roseirectus]